jgi:transposase-like protein
VAAKPTRRTFNADQRRQAVEAFLKSGMPQELFARLYGIAERSLWKWLKQYEAAGPKALEDKKRGRPKGSGDVLARLPDATKAAITAVKAKFPDFGLRKIRDFLFRFHAVKRTFTRAEKQAIRVAPFPLMATGASPDDRWRDRLDFGAWWFEDGSRSTETLRPPCVRLTRCPSLRSS